jgi:hypothetical protein
MPILWKSFIQQTQRELSTNFSVFINEVDIIEVYWKNNQIQVYVVKRYYPAYKSGFYDDRSEEGPLSYGCIELLY